jgi:glycosyltransferase involved in cell wall biosynthesis
MSGDRRPKVFMMDLWATVPYYTAYLSRALLREHVDLTVGSISYYLDPACFSSRGIKLRPGFLNVVGKFRLPRLPRRILKLLESILNLSALTVRFLISPPDIIHVQFLPMLLSRLPLDLWFVQLCRRRGSKIVLTVHDLLPHDTGEEHKQTFRDLYQMVDGIICHSDSIGTRLEKEFNVPKEKIAVIPHGPFFYDLPATDTEQTLHGFDLEPGKLLVLWQGIIFPYKGIDLLLDAWQQVEANSIDACLLIVGTGAPEFAEQIREQISRLGLKHVKLHLRFISTEELVALYRAADIVVYPYRAITTSGALATGLALGKTIVAICQSFANSSPIEIMHW